MVTKTSTISLFFSAMFLAGVAGCIAPVPRPIGAEPAAIGISVEIRETVMSWNAIKPEWIHLVRWVGNDDVTAQAEVVTTNFSSRNRAYLLNAKPGRYSVIATTELAHHPAGAGDLGPVVSADSQTGRHGRGAGGSWNGRAAGGVRPSLQGARPVLVSFSEGDDDDDSDTRRFAVGTTFFNEEIIRSTTLEVLPGQFTFLGDLAVTSDNKMSQGDKAIRHFHGTKNYALLNDLPIPESPTQFWVARGTGVKIERGKDTEAAFLAGALQDLKGSGWEIPLQRALSKVGAK